MTYNPKIKTLREKLSATFWPEEYNKQASENMTPILQNAVLSWYHLL